MASYKVRNLGIESPAFLLFLINLASGRDMASYKVENLGIDSPAFFMFLINPLSVRK